MKYYKHIESEALRWGDIFVDPSQFVEINVEEFKTLKERQEKEVQGDSIQEQFKRVQQSGGLRYEHDSELLPAIECFGERIKNSILQNEMKPEPILNYSKQLDDIDDKVSVDTLDSLIAEHGDLIHARDISNNANCYAFPLFGANNQHIYDRLKLESLIQDKYNVKVSASGLGWYPPGGYMGWHSNSNLPGKRFYVVWAKEDNKSFFRWRDEKTKEIHTKWEKKGWNINVFGCPDWHCVASWTDRVSIGMQELGNGN